MLASISRFFETYLQPPEKTQDEDAVCKLQLASAALLIELCKSDQTISDVETGALLVLLEQKFDLTREMLDQLLVLAEQEAHEATSLYQFTSLINQGYDRDEKVQLIRNMWELAFADGNLDRYEEHMIRKVAELLYVSHSDFIKTKLAVRNSL
ncbi:MAG: TerB family tellurite resistance protein [Pseudomonadales bacterium]|nr:TerB family tellurite resistance protein [Pseudomonadales bacterium]